MKHKVIFRKKITQSDPEPILYWTLDERRDGKGINIIASPDPSFMRQDYVVLTIDVEGRLHRIPNLPDTLELPVDSTGRLVLAWGSEINK